MSSVCANRVPVSARLSTRQQPARSVAVRASVAPQKASLFTDYLNHCSQERGVSVLLCTQSPDLLLAVDALLAGVSRVVLVTSTWHDVLVKSASAYINMSVPAAETWQSIFWRSSWPFALLLGFLQ